MAKSHYPRAFKNEVVQFYERNHSISETLHEYGIAESTLFEWKRHYDEEHFLYVPGPSQRKRYNDTQAHLMKAEQMLEVLDRCSCGIYASTDEKVAAITYAKVGEQYYFICVILDLFSRMVLAYGISSVIDTTLVINTFLSAYTTRCHPRSLMFHSDQGVQYTSFAFRQLLRDYHVRQSFSRPGVPYDNSVCESFFHTLKKEAIYRHLYGTPEELGTTLEIYIKFYNEKRPHRALNMLTPMEMEQKYLKHTK